jgi:hypothetical protein
MPMTRTVGAEGPIWRGATWFCLGRFSSLIDSRQVQLEVRARKLRTDCHRRQEGRCAVGSIKGETMQAQPWPPEPEKLALMIEYTDCC